MNSPIYRLDYKPLTWQVRTVQMVFELHPTSTIVTTISRFERINPGNELVLNGEYLVTRSVRLEGRLLNESEYTISDNVFTLMTERDSFELEIKTELNPSENLALSGLYMSDGYFCTQCEAEGFRRITWSLDRPDNLSVYDVELRADKRMFPILLSNGNLIEEGELDDGRAFARWYDPHPKPGYLFALVAGELAHIQDEFVTMGGRKVRLRIYSLTQYLDQCHYGMECLKRSMKWDEERYGREYDLEQFNIVATDDFNMGAMENKGLNIFNTKLVLAEEQTADDQAFINIEAVIGHEYFHNWSGNRVTCRDWFQLSLKEGFTVFRDQQFTADLHGEGVKRIHDVQLLRGSQFKEDAGPLAHSVRPDSYESINNFYTVTIYEKGAEIVRMLHNILGAELFRKACDYYFSTYDGTAATCDDFIHSMEVTSGLDLSQFAKWYSQAGTPEVTIVADYDGKFARLEIEQRTEPTAGQPDKEALFIPIDSSFFNEEGKKAKIKSIKGCDSRLDEGSSSCVLYIKSDAHSVEIECDQPIHLGSFLRGLSAPIKLIQTTSNEEDAFVAQFETDSFAAWEAGQRIFIRHILAKLKGEQGHIDAVIHYVRSALKSDQLDKTLKAKMMSIPTTGYFIELLDEPVDPKFISNERLALQETLGTELETLWLDLATVTTEPYSLTNEQIGSRSLAAIAFSMLAFNDDYVETLGEAYFKSHNMTDRYNSLFAILTTQQGIRFSCLSDFYARAKPYPVVINTWFNIQITAAHTKALGIVLSLLEHPDYTEKNPNRLRAVIGGMIRNPWAFHDDAGKGYAILADTIIDVDQFNPEMAAGLARAFSVRSKLVPHLSQLMEVHINRILSQPSLSANTREILTKVMAGE